LFLLHHAISPFAEPHNNKLIQPLWHSNLRVKKCTPTLFVFAVLLANSLQSSKA